MIYYACIYSYNIDHCYDYNIVEVALYIDIDIYDYIDTVAVVKLGPIHAVAEYV